MKHYIFTDPHILGGQSFTLATEEEVIQEAQIEHPELSRTEQLHEFVVINSATLITKETYDLLIQINNHFLLGKTR